MNIAFLFPGQGTQYIGMGKDIYDKYEEAREIYKEVEKITNINIEKICFEGPEDILNETKYTQLAVLTESLAILKVLSKYNITSTISAGLSLGEYTALINSGCLNLNDGVKLVQKRGEYMQKFLPEGKWQMAAIIGLNKDIIEKACKEIDNGFVAIANYNTENQTVISGEKEAVEKVAEKLKNIGAKKISILKTEGPFHTEKLVKASKEFRKELDNININKFRTKVVKNVDGKIYSDKDNVKEILEKHIISPVKFTDTIKTILESGVDSVIEIGPRKNISRFYKKDKNR